MKYVPCKGISPNDFCTLSVIVMLMGEGVQAMALRKKRKK